MDVERPGLELPIRVILPPSELVASPCLPARPAPLGSANEQECIVAHPEDARAGVSRPTIKKWLSQKYKLDLSSASNVNNLSNAIKRGAETGALVLPKGIGGKVKLAPKVC
jgi:histone H1/5